MRDKFREAEEANRSLLAAAMILSPTGKEQRGFVALANAPVDPFEAAELLLGALLDGVRHGNWPTDVYP